MGMAKRKKDPAEDVISLYFDERLSIRECAKKLCTTESCG